VAVRERLRSNNSATPAASAELCDEDLDDDEITRQLNFEMSSSDGINSSSNYVFSPSASTSLTSSKLSSSLRRDHDLFTSFIDTATATAAAAASQLRQTLSSEIAKDANAKASIIQCSDSR
jgi:hypothetical protein